MSHMSELDIAKQNGDTITKHRTVRGLKWVCLSCLQSARKKYKLKHEKTRQHHP